MYLGFQNIEEFFATVSFGSIKTNVAATTATFGSAVTAAGLFLSEWVIEEEKVYIFLIVSLLFDWVLGMIRGSRSDGGFKTAKALRIFPIIITHLFIIAAINQLAGIEIATVAGGGITAITTISIIKNASVVGWIDGAVGKYLQKHVDIHKNIVKK